MQRKEAEVQSAEPETEVQRAEAEVQRMQIIHSKNCS